MPTPLTEALAIDVLGDVAPLMKCITAWGSTGVASTQDSLRLAVIIGCTRKLLNARDLNQSVICR